MHVFETPKRVASASEALSGSSTPSYMSGPSGPTLGNPQPAASVNGRASSTTTTTGTAAGEATEKVNKDKSKKPHRKYHIPMNEALAILEGRTPVYPKKKTLFQKFIELESVLRCDASLIALKTAAAVSLKVSTELQAGLQEFTLITSLVHPSIGYCIHVNYSCTCKCTHALALQRNKSVCLSDVSATLTIPQSSRSFFVQYALTGGVLSVVVAMSPSLGQTLFTFVNQIIGTVSGNIYGMILLYIFRDVGGYKYNP